MINELEIHNFKSIKDLTLPCKRFNLFIGEPNTGKSNILEALGLVSFVGARTYDTHAKLEEFVRHKRSTDLFYNGNLEENILVRLDDSNLQCKFDSDHRFHMALLGPQGLWTDIDLRKRIRLSVSEQERIENVQYP